MCGDVLGASVIQHCPRTLGTESAAKVDCPPETPGRGHFYRLDNVGHAFLTFVLFLYILHLIQPSSGVLELSLVFAGLNTFRALRESECIAL